MRILVVSSYLPFPLYSGGHIRLYNLLKELSASHKITLICEKRDYQTERDRSELTKFCEQVITVPRRKQWTVSNIVKTIFSRYPFLLVGHTSKEFKQEIVKALNNKRFDVIHVETFYVYQNIPKTYLPVVLAEHNIEYLVYQRYTNISPIYLRPFLALDVMKIKHWEMKSWQSVSKLIAVSDREKEIMHRENVTVVPNGVDTKLYKLKSTLAKQRRKEKRILFIGDFKWIQNIQAVEQIIKNIWPLVTEKLSLENEEHSIKLWIVGKRIPQHLKALQGKNIFFDENAPDETWKIYHLADMLLAPITVGGGTSYKILESMATGLPVITTPLGVEGIGAKKNQEVLIGETSQEIADQVVRLIQDKMLYETISQNARKLIEEKYDWKVISKKLEYVYKQAISYV